MYCDEEFQACGTVDLSGASVRRQLILSGAYLDGKDGAALDADKLTVTGAMFCDEGFQADGTARHRAARGTHERPGRTAPARGELQAP